MNIDDDRVDEAIDAYDWVRASTFSPVGHAVMERLAEGAAMRTLCGHVFAARDDRLAIMRCGTCLNVIYAKLGVR